MNSTKVSINLRPSEKKDKWYLVLESYPIWVTGRKTRERSNIGKSVTSVKWRKDPLTGILTPVKDKNGIIQCTKNEDIVSCQFAEQLRRKKQAEFDRLSLLTPEERELAESLKTSEEDFIDYMDYLKNERHSNSSESIKINWNQAIKLLKLFTKNEPLPLRDITISKLEELKNFLLVAPMGGGKKGTLSQNSASTYFAIIKCALHQCFIDGYMNIDIASKIKGIPEEDSKREFLSQEEVQKLIETPCEDDILKRASLFSILTGARHSDIMKLTWGEIQDNGNQTMMNFKQKKTKNANYLPISDQARQLCGKRREDNKLVFEDLTPPSWISRPLDRWIKSAGITKHITFHCFRHTFATLQLSAGTDIYTVSKMLGHTNVKTTQIYAKIVDELKLKAANALKFNFNNISLEA